MPALRELGHSGLHVAPLALGGNVFGWNVDEKVSFALLDAFVEAGFNLVDTADMYSSWAPGNRGGESETIIGRWLKARPGMRANFTGLDVPDRFLFGCGMDYRGYWRNAPGIYAIKDSQDS